MYGYSAGAHKTDEGKLMRSIARVQEPLTTPFIADGTCIYFWLLSA